MCRYRRLRFIRRMLGSIPQEDLHNLHADLTQIARSLYDDDLLSFLFTLGFEMGVELRRGAFMSHAIGHIMTGDFPRTTSLILNHLETPIDME